MGLFKAPSNTIHYKRKSKGAGQIHTPSKRLFIHEEEEEELSSSSTSSKSATPSGSGEKEEDSQPMDIKYGSNVEVYTAGYEPISGWGKNVFIHTLT